MARPALSCRTWHDPLSRSSANTPPETSSATFIHWPNAMPIELKCPSCGQTLRVPDDAAGKHARCAQCQAVILVPASDTPSPTPMDPPLGGPNPPTPYRETPMTNPYDAPKTETPFKGPSPSQGTNTLAIVSLVLGVCSFTIGCCCWLHIPLGLGAAITGYLGMQKANEGLGGKGMAIAGMVMGIASLVLLTALGILGVAMNLGGMQFQQQFNQ